MEKKFIRLNIPLSVEESQALRAAAQKDLRHPKDQARYLLRSALFGDPPTMARSEKITMTFYVGDEEQAGTLAAFYRMMAAHFTDDLPAHEYSAAISYDLFLRIANIVNIDEHELEQWNIASDYPPHLIDYAARNFAQISEKLTRLAESARKSQAT